MKLRNSLLLLPLFLFGCGTEQAPAPPQIVEKPPAKPAAVHFELKDEPEDGFKMDTQEPEGLTEEFKQQILAAEEAERLALGNQGASQTEVEATQSVTPSDSPQIGVAPEEEPEQENSLDLPSIGDTEKSTETDIFDYPPSTVKYSEVPVAFVSEDIKKWVEERETESGAYVKEDGEALYLLVAAGERGHTGYKMLINGIYEKETDIEIHFELEETKSGSLNIPSKPLILISIPITEKTIQFYGDL